MICDNCGLELPEESRICLNCGNIISREANNIMEFNRIIFKDRAKKALSKNYWRAFFACLISGMLSGGVSFSYRTSASGDIWTQLRLFFALIQYVAIFKMWY